MTARTLTRPALDDLLGYPGNPRRGDVSAIAEFLERNGQFRPLVVQRSTNYVLDGNHTLQAMRSLGWKRADAYVVDVDDQGAKRIVAAANRIADLGTYDNRDLLELLESIDDGLDGTGYSDDNLAAFITNLEKGDHEPVDASGDPRLDQQSWTTCPSCGHEFEPRTYNRKGERPDAD